MARSSDPEAIFRRCPVGFGISSQDEYPALWPAGSEFLLQVVASRIGGGGIRDDQRNRGIVQLGDQQAFLATRGFQELVSMLLKMSAQDAPDIAIRLHQKRGGPFRLDLGARGHHFGARKIDL